MKSNNNYAISCLRDLPESLAAAFGKEKGDRIFDAAQKILASELAEVDDRGNKTIGRHIRCNILPGYACYRAMLDAGISSSKAVAFVRAELFRYTERMAKLCRRLSTKKYTYGMLRMIIGAVLNYGYPKQGWTVTMLEKNKQRIRFDITSCLYCEELKKRGALELCPAFCDTDVASYSPLAPSVLFKRENTFEVTGVKCDFCFEKGTVIR
ncbi:MAG: L-2-amino-thiazoline-4-carboxylic acid hydrolase [Thermoclostridium sp.]|nr:L-2-amino-thiazoline-4-carboxylic acid hydrolase [Thermoclostridium sp.]